MNFADLHIHTHFSDGQASPKDLLERSKQLGLQTIAITDHETTRGNREAQTLAARYGIEVIPAVEITCFWEGYTGHGGGADVDILGYFLDLESSTWQETETRLAEGIVARAATACGVLQQQGYDLRLEDVLETNPTYPGYMPIVQSLQRLNLVMSLQEAHALTDRAYISASQSPFSIAEGIQLIRDAGGVVILAHPSIIRRASDGELLSERGVMDLARMGLDGIEVFHYRLRDQQRRHFAMLAKMFRLAISGGSDEHGGPGEMKRLGSEPITQEIVERLCSIKQSR
ncbi:MAG: PHP domain-containing protein [Trueperaceae bacterium]